MADFQLQIVTQERVIFDDRVTSIIAPGELGYLGVLAHHAPLLTTLKRGKLTICQDSRQQVFLLETGFLEVQRNLATLLTDTLTPVEESGESSPFST